MQGAVEGAGSAERGLAQFIQSAKQRLGEDLRSAIVYGSAAVGEQRSTSDVNLILVLRNFDPERSAALREPLRLAHAAIRLEVMFLCEAEIDQALELFADKFADVARRRRVLYGDDVFEGRVPSRRAQLRRLRQALLNHLLRMRQRYLLASLREEQAVSAIAQVAGPLRVSAATLRALEGKPELPPKQALAACVEELMPGAGLDLDLISAAREGRSFPPGRAPDVLRQLLVLTQCMHEGASALAGAEA